VDGLIIASAQSNGRRMLFRNLRKRKVPFVLIDRMLPGLDAHFVGVRDEEIGALATRHLVEQGCRRIAHIRGPAISTGTGRLRGYRRALAEAGLRAGPEYVVSGEHSDASGYKAMIQLLGLDQRPDGVFCFNDPVAAGAIKAILAAGLDVPGDIAVIGAGNVHYSDLLRIPLSTVDQSCSLLGETAAQVLIRSIESDGPLPPERILLPPQLVIRDSTRRR